MRILPNQLYVLQCLLRDYPGVNTRMLSLRQFLVQRLSFRPNNCKKIFQNRFSVERLLLFRFHYMRLLNNLMKFKRLQLYIEKQFLEFFGLFAIIWS